MIQRVQSIYLFFAVLFMLGIAYFIPVLIISDNEMFYTYELLYSHVTILIASFLLLFSIFQFKNRKKQLVLNQIAKLFLSATFFILFFSKGQAMPYNGMFAFIIPYVLILLANRYIKKDEKLVQSADRIR
jgi:peptidoglycan/LPS O-acetylase OafA/YrhL